MSADTYPPQRVDVAVLFGEELAGRGHKIDWLLQSEAACLKSYVTPWGGGRAWVGATDLGDALWRRVHKHVLGIAHDLKLFGLLRRGDYDVIEVKDKFISGLFGLVAARLFRKRFVYWLSYPFPEEYLIRAKDGTARYPLLYTIRGTIFKILLYRMLLPAADHVFVQSEQMRRDVAAEGVPPAKMTAVPMGIKTADPSVIAERAHNSTVTVADSTAISPTLHRSGSEPAIPAGEKCFLYLGTLGKVRRMDFLIRVLAEVLREEPEVKLYFVGRGDLPDDEQVLVDEAQRLGVLSSVVFVGQLPQPQALRYVQAADVCVSPFYPTPVLNSTSPTKLIEYMAMGKAVVANDHPEQRLVIEASGGGLCVPYDEKSFAAAIVQLLRAPGRARTMGEAGRDYVLKHRSYKTIADSVEQQLLQVVYGANANANAAASLDANQSSVS